MNTKTIKKSLIYIIIFILGIFFDQMTKKMAVSALKDQQPIPLIKNIFELQYLENRGAAFGIFQNQQLYFLICVIVVTIIIIVFFIKAHGKSKLLPLELCGLFILTGAYGNAIDRIVNGYVVDFFYFKLIDFPIFNVADIYVTVATCVLALLLIFYYKEEDLDQLTSSKGNRDHKNR